MVRVVVLGPSRPTPHNVVLSSPQTSTLDKTLGADTDIKVVVWLSAKHSRHEDPLLSEKMESEDRDPQGEFEVEVEKLSEDTGAIV